jgi:hypothetical protein
VEIFNEIMELNDSYQKLLESVIWRENIAWVKSYYLECEVMGTLRLGDIFTKDLGKKKLNGEFVDLVKFTFGEFLPKRLSNF